MSEAPEMEDDSCRHAVGLEYHATLGQNEQAALAERTENVSGSPCSRACITAFYLAIVARFELLAHWVECGWREPVSEFRC
jgi:hypothetical protein